MNMESQLNKHLKENNMTKEKDLALITSIILNEDILGGTIFQTFDKAYALAEKFQDKFSHDFNWENQKLDFDESIILFTKQQIEISLDKFEKEIEEIERIEKDNN